jgi:hypothetical protein
MTRTECVAYFTNAFGSAESLLRSGDIAGAMSVLVSASAMCFDAHDTELRMLAVTTAEAIAALNGGEAWLAQSIVATSLSE